MITRYFIIFNISTREKILKYFLSIDIRNLKLNFLVQIINYKKKTINL
jgi:hypothetical protein